MNKITDQREFKKLVLDKLGLHVVRFCAEWSGACQMMAPIYEELSKVFQYRAAFYTIDIDEATALKKELGVSELPTLLFYRDGALVGRTVGMQSKEALIALFQQVIDLKK